MANRGKRTGRLTFLVTWVLALLLLAQGAQAQDGGSVLVLEFKGAVTRTLLSYIERGIAHAESTGAAAVVLQLDTPGGDEATMQEIIQRILRSPVPVIVYVAPTGAHASSAGTLIALAGHLAAMAPNTTIGAASPVDSTGGDLPDTIKSKLVNTLVKDAENLARSRNRGDAAIAWAGRAVSEAATATDSEALALGVVDAVATDVADLLRHVDGRTVDVQGEAQTLNVADRPIVPFAMDWIEQILNVVVSPTVATILLTIGVQALLIELSNPGGWIPGIVGAVCLALALYALGALNANWLGLAFIALAFILFFLDVQSGSLGLLSVLGIASFIGGAAILFSTPTTQVPWGTVIGVALVTAAFFLFVMAKLVQAHHRQAATGFEAMLGAVGTARTALEPDGDIFVWGELWQAQATDGPIAKGEKVQVLGRDGLRLKVTKAEPSQ